MTVNRASTRIYGGVEGGGTKWACAAGSGPDDIRGITVFATTSPQETIGRAAEFFRPWLDELAAVGLGSFGPIDIRPSSPTWGHITTTPKPGWTDVDVVGSLQTALGLPIAVDTDVNAAALGEYRWGAAAGLETFCYVTVGTGIGGGVMTNGQLMHGLLHPEFGHMRIPHDRGRDSFEGACPYHGDCLEGLASGEAMRRRWGGPGQELGDREEAWQLEADYLALGLVNVICTLSPERVVLGGGVMKQPRLLPLVRSHVRKLMGGYGSAPQLDAKIDEYVVAPALGDRAGVLGAIELARLSLHR
jgi:fructokinase